MNVFEDVNGLNPSFPRRGKGQSRSSTTTASFSDSKDVDELVLEMSRVEHAQSSSEGSTTRPHIYPTQPIHRPRGQKPPPLPRVCKKEYEQELKEELAAICAA